MECVHIRLSLLRSQLKVRVRAPVIFSLLDKDDEEGDVFDGDGNKTLVVRKILLTPKGDSGGD